MGNRSGISAQRSGWRHHVARAALVAGLLVAALAPWSSDAAHGAGTAPLFGCSAASYTVGASPYAVALGDLNGDGRPDLVSANYGANTVSVLLGQGVGTFQRPQTAAVGSLPSSVAVGDFNGDGLLDLVTTNYGSATVSVLLGNGDGTFQPQRTAAVGHAPRSVAVGDLNHDGTEDLVTANFGNGDDDVSVLLGNGDGTFQSQRTAAVGIEPDGVAVGDLNGDGTLDIVGANYHDNTVSVLLGHGDGTFQPQQTAAVGTKPAAVALGDLNNDGSLDLVTANYASADVSVLLGRGDGTFQRQTTAAVRADPSSVAVGDLNGDGRLDIVAANSLSNNVSILLGHGDGTFQPQQTAAVGSRPYAVAVGDLNHDGTPDLVTANNASSTASVLLNGMTTCLMTSPTSGSPTTPLTLSGTHFGVHEGVTLYWDSGATPPLTRTTTDVSGAFLVTATTPQAVYGTHLLIGVGQISGLSATTTFQVTPLVTLAPSAGVSDTAVTASGAGFGAGETVTLYWGMPRSGRVVGTTTTSAKGQFAGATAISFTVPAVPPGSYQVCGQGQSSLAQRCATFSVTG